MTSQLLPLLGVLLMVGCSSSHILINAKANRPIPAKSNHVVMPANDMEDLDAADRLAVLTEDVLLRRGIRSDRSRDADVIVVTQAALITASGQEIAMKPAQMQTRSTVPRQPSEDAFGSVAALALGVADSRDWVPVHDFTARASGEPLTEKGDERLRVTVKTAPSKEWMKPEMTFHSLPAAWTVTVEGRATPAQRDRFFAQALDAASLYFAQNTDKPRRRAISLDSAGEPSPRPAITHQEPDFTLDPLR
jgi:hypothetical protein